MTNGKFQRALVAAFLIVAIVLVSGSIYLHVRQKHRYGRLNHARHSSNAADAVIVPVIAAAAEYTYETSTVFVETGSAEFVYDTPMDYLNWETMLRFEAKYVGTERSASTDESIEDSNDSVSDEISTNCLRRICESASRCQPSYCGVEKIPCGIYRISEAYWQDAYRLTTVNASQHEDYKNCVTDKACAERTVRLYLERYARDCNDDYEINCEDFVLIHVLGPTGCRKDTLDSDF